MEPAPVGTRIRVTHNFNDHNYSVGSIYRIVQDDDDGTFKAANAAGHVGNWLRWEECELAPPSLWDQLAPDLPDDIVRFLSCFDGIQSLALKREVADAILRKLPDLHERVAAMAGSSQGAAMLARNVPRPLDLGSHS
jgi:hypothetical protein